MFFFLSLFAAIPVMAQLTTSVKAGGSFASLYYKSQHSNQGRIAGYGGLSFKVDLQKQFFFQPEALYSVRGYRFPPNGFYSGGRVGYGYITFPLLVGYKPAKNFSILAGPELGYMVRANSRYDGANNNILSTIGRRFNVDADAGIAWNVTTELSLEARFSFGVMSLYRGILIDEFGNQIGQMRDGYHRVLQVGLALAL